ncbi:MAG: hypothetical protein M1819_005099 [Sarea resinae]|nr:MAG: hypothetical protein M1819_005099 [Sarea resinae]
MGGIRTFDEWSVDRCQTIPFSAFQNAVIGIEASHYLDRLLSTPPSKEPLLSALGGSPFALRAIIEKEVESLREAGITAVFVFNGMETVKKDKTFNDINKAARANAQAWEHYDQNHAEQAVETFGKSGSVKPEKLYRFLQRILRESHVEFRVAPYSACAQLAYLDKHPLQFIDAIVGSSELFLFDVDKIITKIDFQRSQFTWLSKSDCLEDLGKISTDIFIDACLLSGSSFLPTFPPLENPALYRKPFNIRDVVNMIDDAQVQQTDYLDSFKRARMGIKHHVVLATEGKYEPLDIEHAPSDVHEFIGQRLPEELYFYLSEGVISPRVLNWLVSGDILETPPLENGEASEYQRLVRDQLTPIRTQALSLLSQSLHRFYQRKEIYLRFWFDKGGSKSINLKDFPSPKEYISSWNVKQAVLQGQRHETGIIPGSLTFAVQCLNDKEFVSKTFVSKNPSTLLKSEDEVLSNTLFRFLQLRGYVDAKHNLTSWGKALRAALAALNPADHLEEAVFVAIELLRLDILNANEMFPSYSGAPMRGSETDKRNCLLISRLACLGKLRHKSIGFAGPLSRHLLAYHTIVSAVRNSLRDLLDISLVTLLLNGDADRDRDDWIDLGLDLPFVEDTDCGLGIAVKSYLDELMAQPDPTSPATRDTVKAKGPNEWFWHVVDFTGDLEIAFRLWDAVFKGVQAAGSDVKDSTMWADADAWLAQRR